MSFARARARKEKKARNRGYDLGGKASASAFELNNRLMAKEISYKDMENRIVRLMSRKPCRRVLQG